jgi:CDP-diacylglycerol--serine O-phosphatidyltransferase
MIKYIPNFLTLINLLIGAIGSVQLIVYRNLNLAIIFVGVAALFDFLDGFAARLLKAESRIGVQLDSFADLISFGFLPSCFMMVWLAEDTSSVLPYAGFLIVLFSALRLARFNVTVTKTSDFEGLPTPANAIMITSLSLLTIDVNILLKLSIVLIATFLLVSRIPFLSLKFTDFSWKKNQSKWVLIAGVIVGGIIFDIRIVPFIIPFYIVVSILSGVMRKK